MTAVLFLAVFMALILLFGGHQPRAAAVPQQVLTTNPPASAPSSSTPAPTSIPTVAPTPPATTARPTATTRPAASTVAPAVRTPSRAAVVTYPSATYVTPTSSAPATTAPPAPTTTILGIGGRIPVSPVTLPLHTTSSNGHVNPAFAWLSAGGFALFLLIIAVRLWVTRPKGKDRAPLTRSPS